MRLGYVGTGVMVHPLARCLIEVGHALTAYDVRRAATTGLCGRGVRWADNPYAVAQVRAVVFTPLPGPTEVEQGVLDPRTGLLARTLLYGTGRPLA
jgi:3-hydroxyisobutyrate dehydrogenase-like beta-hydroxyacid dehydrogenase